MKVTPVLCFFLLLFIVLVFSAYGSTLAVESHSQKQPKVIYGMIKGSNRAGSQRTYPGLHVVQHGTTIKRARAIYGGSNDIRHPRSRNSAHSLSIKHSSLFVAAFRHLSFGLLLLVCFF